MASKLTNKFTKSVSEREQKEQRNIEISTAVPKTTKAPAPLPPKKAAESISVQQSNIPIFPAAQPPITPAIAPTVKQPDVSATPRPVKKTVLPASMNLDAFLNPSESRQAKNKTFYLDTAVIDAIKQAATANHIAESKLVNDILKKIFGV